MAAFYVYIMTNRPYGTLYVGMTNTVSRRVWEHRNDVVAGFTRRHELHRLVWYERHDFALDAIRREKQLKRWHRDWKVNLIQSMNPEWADLYPRIALPEDLVPANLGPGPSARLRRPG